MLHKGFFKALNNFNEIIKKKIRNIYLNSSFYEKKLSKTFNNDFIYKPSPHLLSSLIKYQTKKININDISSDNLWENKDINNKKKNQKYLFKFEFL